MKFSLQDSATKAASASGAVLTFGGAGMRALKSTRSLIFTLDVISAERDTGDETYDVYVTTSDGLSSWDVCHFPQIATTGAKRYTMRVDLDIRPENVTTASPGVAANDSASLLTSSTNAIKTLAAGSVRNGPIGETLSHELVVAGAVVTGIKYALTVQGR